MDKSQFQELPAIITSQPTPQGAGHWVERFFPHLAFERIVEQMRFMADQTKKESLHLALSLYDYFGITEDRDLLQKFADDQISLTQLQQAYNRKLLATPPHVHKAPHLVRWLIQQCILALRGSAFRFDLDTLTYEELQEWSNQPESVNEHFEFSMDYLSIINTLMQIAPSLAIPVERRTDEQLATVAVWLRSIESDCLRWLHLHQPELTWIHQWSQQEAADTHQMQIDRIQAISLLHQSAGSKPVG